MTTGQGRRRLTRRYAPTSWPTVALSRPLQGARAGARTNFPRRSSTIGVDKPLAQTAENVLNVPDIRVSLSSVPETWIGHDVPDCSTSDIAAPTMRPVIEPLSPPLAAGTDNVQAPRRFSPNCEMSS